MKRGIAETCYGFFSTLANPTRLAILEQLRDADMNVTQLAKALQQEQSMISHNLKPLLRCRFVYSNRQGKSRIYRLNKEIVGRLFATVADHAENHCVMYENCPHAH